MTTQTENMELVGNFFAALGSGDMETAAAAVADDIRWTYHGPKDSVPFAGEFSGMVGIGEFFGQFMEVAEPVEMTPKAMWASENMVFSSGIETSKSRATGKQYSVEWVHVLTVENGKIQSFDEYLDTATVAAAFVAG